MTISWNEISEKSNGGTEAMARRLEKDLDPDIASEVQIIPSRVRELKEDKIRVLWCHDLPADPESDHLKNGGWNKFHRIVFVSYWQRDWYIRHYNIPYHKCAVIRNAIEPIEPLKEDSFDPPKNIETIKLIYHTTPHRGLELLVPVFTQLAKKHDNITLDVFSSFKAYGWDDRDKPYEKLFAQIDEHDKMTNHGFQSNEIIRKHLSESHIFAYPSIWMETSCISLIEAMSAGCLCVHSDYGALPETSADWTMMYSYNENPNKHAATFYHVLDLAIELIKENNDNTKIKLKGQKAYADLCYNWEIKKHQWNVFLRSLLNEPRELVKQKKMFEYKL